MMNNHRPYKVPEAISSEEDLNEWLEEKLDDLENDPNPFMLIQLHKEIHLFWKRKHGIFKAETIAYYNRLYVFALIDNGWLVKQNVRGLNPEAIGYFEKALEIIPENPVACYRLGHLMHNQGEKGKAIGYFSRAIELSIGDSRIHDKLKLNSAQTDNAKGLSLALLSELTGSFSNSRENFYSSEQVESLRNLLNQTWRSHVIHTIHKAGTECISNNEYSLLLESLHAEHDALIIDRFEGTPTIGHSDVVIPISRDRLYYLLTALKLEPATGLEGSTTFTSRSTTIRRLRDNLEEIGIHRQMLDIVNSRLNGVSIISNITIHYFKSLLD